MAIPALHHFKVEPSLLDLTPSRGFADAIDGRDRAAADRPDGQEARAHRNAVEVNGAGPALRDAAAEFRSGQTENVAQRPKQRHVICGVNSLYSAIDLQTHHRPDPIGFAPNFKPALAFRPVPKRNASSQYGLFDVNDL